MFGEVGFGRDFFLGWATAGFDAAGFDAAGIDAAGLDGAGFAGVSFRAAFLGGPNFFLPAGLEVTAFAAAVVDVEASVEGVGTARGM